MRKLLIIGALTVSGCAATPGPIVEAGYPTGSLAVAAIERGDWAAAEALLTRDGRVAADDPARLINLGRVYMATGRSREAVAAWTQALQSRHPVLVETAGGRMIRTDRLAREALEHSGAPIRTAAR